MKLLSFLLSASLVLHAAAPGIALARPSKRSLHQKGVENTARLYNDVKADRAVLFPQELRERQAAQEAAKETPPEEDTTIDFESETRPSKRKLNRRAKHMRWRSNWVADVLNEFEEEEEDETDDAEETGEEQSAEEVETTWEGVSGQASAVASGQLPPFPEDAVRPQIDWGDVDWSTTIVTPFAQEEFNQERDRLRDQGLHEEAQALEPKQVMLVEDEALAFLRPPEEVETIVRSFQAEMLEAGEEPVSDKKARKILRRSQHEIAKAIKKELKAARKKGKGHSTGDVSIVPSDTLDLGVMKSRNGNKYLQVLRAPAYDPETGAPITTPETLQFEGGIEIPVNSIPQGNFPDLRLKVPQSGPQARMDILSLFVPKALAASVNGLMSYYEGIEDVPVDLLLLYIASIQNDDGSVGHTNQYIHTFRIAELLSQMDKHYTDEYGQMITYLRTAEPGNNRERALKARLLVSLGESADALMDELTGAFSQVQVDGIERIVGIGFDEGFEPDVETMLDFAEASLVTGLHTDLLPYTIIWISNRIDTTGYLRYKADAGESYHLINSVIQGLSRFRGHTYSFDIHTVNVDDKLEDMLGYLRNDFDHSADLLMSGDDVIDELMTLHSFQMQSSDADITHTLRDYLVRKQHVNGSYGNSIYATTAALAAMRQADLRVHKAEPLSPVNGQSLTVRLSVENIGQLPLHSLRTHVFADGHFIGTHTVVLSSPLTQFTSRDVDAVFPASFTETLVGSTNLQLYVEVPSEAEEEDNWAGQTVTFAGNPDGSSAVPLLTQGYLKEATGDIRFDGALVYRDDPQRSELILHAHHIASGDQADVTIPTGSFTHGNRHTFTVTLPMTHLGDYDISLMSKATDDSLHAGTAVRTNPEGDIYPGDVALSARENSHVLPWVTLWSFFGEDPITDYAGDASLIGHRTGLFDTRVLTAPYEPLWHRFTVAEGVETQVDPIITRTTIDTEAPHVDELRMAMIRNMYRSPGTYTIEVVATDNLAPTQALLEYYDPHDTQWHTIAIAPFTSPTLLQYEWDMPATLEGPGYVLRATVSDASGNTAAPFIDPDFLSFTIEQNKWVIVEGLVNNEWALGETKTIRFDYQGALPLEFVDSTYLVSDAYRYKVHSWGGTQETIEVTLPLNGSRLAESAYIESEFYDSNFDELLGFSLPFAVVDKTEPPQPPWQTPTTFLESDPGTLLSRSVDYIHERKDGGVDMVYRETDGSIVLIGSETNKLVFRSFRDGSWQPPVIISQVTATTTEERLTMNSVKVVRDDAGGLHISYRQYLGADDEDAQIHYALIRNQQLQEAVQMSDNAVEANRTSLAAHADGTVAVGWSEAISIDDRSHHKVGVHRRQSGVWQDAEIIADAGAIPAVAIEGNTVVVTYKDATNILVRVFDEGSWSAAVSVLDDQGGIPHAAKMLDPILFSLGGGKFDLFFAELNNTGANPFYLSHFDLNADYTVATMRSERSLVDNLDKDVNDFKILRTEFGTYHALYSKKNYNATLNHIYHIYIDEESVMPTSHVFSLIVYAHIPVLTGTGTHVVAYATVQSNGFSHYQIQRNEADFPDILPNIPPEFLFVEPNGVDDTAGTSFTVEWTDNDPDSDAQISLYYDTDADGSGGTLIVSGISENDPADSYSWNTEEVPNGDYWLYAVVDDGEDSIMTISAHAVTVDHGGPGVNQAPTFAFVNPSSTVVQPTWQSTVGVVQEGDVLRKTEAVRAWNAGSFSNEKLQGNGSLSFIATEEDKDRYVGLSYEDVDENYASLEYSIGLFSSNRVMLFDNAELVTGATTYQEGDVFTIKRTDRNVVALKNGVPFHSFRKQSSQDLYVDTSFLDTNASVSNLELTTDNTPVVDASYDITWNDSDPDSNARIALYYSTESEGTGGTLIVTDVPENDTADSFTWDTSVVPPGTYYLNAVISDSINPAVAAQSSTPIIVRHSGTNTVPSLTFLTPVAGEQQAETTFDIVWQDSDPDDDAQIRFYYDTDHGGEDGVLINDVAISEDDETDLYTWSIDGLPVGNYFLYAELEDGTNAVTTVYADLAVTVSPQIEPRNETRLDLTWASLTGIVQSGSILSKVAAQGWENAGSLSTESIDGDGALEFTATETDLTRVVGLSQSNERNSFNSIDYALMLLPSSALTIYEKGVYTVNLPTYSTGDRIRIERKDTTVLYYLNDRLIHTSRNPSSGSLHVATSFYDVGATIDDQHFLIPEAVGQIIIPTWQTFDGYALSGSTIYKTDADGWNARAFSQEALDGDGIFQFIVPDAVGTRSIGLVTADNLQQNASIDHEFLLLNSNMTIVKELGTYNMGLPDYIAGNTVGIERAGDTVTYLLDGRVIFTSTQSNIEPLYIVVNFYEQGAQLRDLELVLP